MIQHGFLRGAKALLFFLAIFQEIHIKDDTNFFIYGLSPYADIDTSDRYAVADFVGTWVSEIYEDGKSRKMDTSVAGKISEYPLYCMRQKSE